MITDETQTVLALQASLAERVGRERFELWFGANTRLALEDGSLKVSVPSQFYQDWLRSHFRSHLEASCLEALGKQLDVTFHVDAQLAQAAPVAAPAKPGNSTQPGGEATQSARAIGQQAVESRPVATDTVQSATSPQPQATTSRRRFASLDGFVVGSSNRVAEASARSIVERLGHVSPLVIHGPTGVGKTHLLEGIWGAAKSRHARLHAVYLSAEQFTSYFLEALHGSGLPSFRRKYRGVELLLIDDLQFFAGKKQTTIELQHTIDTLQREGRQLVFAADRSPAEMEGLGPELIARLSGGLVCRVDSPDYETRLGIVRRLAARLEMALPDEVVTWVASRISSNARELAGALNRLLATSRAYEQPITLALAEDALAETVRHAGKAVRLADIQTAVCSAFGVEPEALKSGRKTKNVAHPRMLAMWLAKKHTRAGLAEIGNFFGRRSHSTVISAQKKIELWMGANSRLEMADRSWSVEDAIRRVEEKLLAG